MTNTNQSFYDNFIITNQNDILLLCLLWWERFVIVLAQLCWYKTVILSPYNSFGLLINDQGCT